MILLIVGNARITHFALPPKDHGVRIDRHKIEVDTIAQILLTRNPYAT